MKANKLFLPLLLMSLFMSCTKDDIPVTESSETGEEEEERRNLEVEEFIYKGMNDIYLYKADTPELADDYFSDSEEKFDFFASFDNPEDFFYDGLRSSQDRFSVLVDDYVKLENRSAGIATTNGMQVTFGKISGTDDVFGLVRYILPNTSAEAEGVKRGHVFTEIDGEKMTVNNYWVLYNQSSYTIDLNTIENNTITPSGETATLTRTEYSTNPVLISKVLDLNGIKVGYVMYNSFTAPYDDELNAAFADLQAKGAQELVLDLRYNGGGSVESAVDLSSMITGQFEGEVFLRQQWNEEYQTAFNSQNPEWLVDRFNKYITIDRNSDQQRQELINSLGLGRVYVITTGSTASASELVINGLTPYIDVVQVGTTTVGKFQASTRMYDSPGFFNKDGINTNHTYAMQPLIYKSANRDGNSDYVDGLTPDITIAEDYNNFGELGNPSEPLLNAALNHISGQAQNHEQIAKAKENARNFKVLGESGMDSPTYQRMYVEEIPSARTK